MLTLRSESWTEPGAQSGSVEPAGSWPPEPEDEPLPPPESVEPLAPAALLAPAVSPPWVVPAEPPSVEPLVVPAELPEVEPPLSPPEVSRPPGLPLMWEPVGAGPAVIVVTGVWLPVGA